MNNFLPHQTFSNFATKNATGGTATREYKGYTQTSANYLAIKNKLIDIAKSVGCDANKSSIMVNFFSDDDNWIAIIDTYDKFSYPMRNRTSVRPCFLCKWIDYCDWQEVYRFYNFAKVSYDYPRLANEKKNCYQIKSALVSLETAKANSILADTYYKTALEEKISEYNSLFASMSCDKFIIDEEKRQAEELAKREQELAQKLQAEAFDKASGNKPTEGSKTSNYILYGFVGVAAIVFLIVLSKRVKKD
jgi:hypothetical protein